MELISSTSYIAIHHTLKDDHLYNVLYANVYLYYAYDTLMCNITIDCRCQINILV